MYGLLVWESTNFVVFENGSSGENIFIYEECGRYGLRRRIIRRFEVNTSHI
jgi:hypothetical protein